MDSNPSGDPKNMSCPEKKTEKYQMIVIKILFSFFFFILLAFVAMINSINSWC